MANIPVPGHAVVLARLALQFVAAVHEMETAFRNDVEGFDEGDVHLEVRVGINSGPVTGGVIGKPFRLDVTAHLKPGENTIEIAPLAPKAARLVFYANKKE